MNIPFDSPELDGALYALSNVKRRGILHDLSFQPSTVAQLAKNHSLSLPAIHKHIRTLETASLIVRKKHGRINFVALNPATLGMVQHWIMQYKTEWGNVHATLENYIARMQE
jgi:predicted transcriptional regulator